MAGVGLHTGEYGELDTARGQRHQLCSRSLSLRWRQSGAGVAAGASAAPAAAADRQQRNPCDSGHYAADGICCWLFTPRSGAAPQGAETLTGAAPACCVVCACPAAVVRVRPAFAGEGRYFVRVPEGTNRNRFAFDAGNFSDKLSPGEACLPAHATLLLGMFLARSSSLHQAEGPLICTQKSMHVSHSQELSTHQPFLCHAPGVVPAAQAFLRHAQGVVSAAEVCLLACCLLVLPLQTRLLLHRHLLRMKTWRTSRWERGFTGGVCVFGGGGAAHEHDLRNWGAIAARAHGPRLPCGKLGPSQTTTVLYCKIKGETRLACADNLDGALCMSLQGQPIVHRPPVYGLDMTCVSVFVCVNPAD
jgi:hypothetical protein